MSAPNDGLLDLDQTALAVASLTGIKQQFVDAGWTPRGAEEMTLAMLASSIGK